MSVYFIHAEVLNGSNIVTKLCAVVTASDPERAFEMFLDCDMVEGHESKGRDVVIDKLEKVE
nr:MAG TPA: hypothetical protein [Caudoviricetes sp.]